MKTESEQAQSPLLFQIEINDEISNRVWDEFKIEIIKDIDGVYFINQGKADHGKVREIRRFISEEFQEY